METKQDSYQHPRSIKLLAVLVAGAFAALTALMEYLWVGTIPSWVFLLPMLGIFAGPLTVFWIDEMRASMDEEETGEHFVINHSVNPVSEAS